MGNILGHNSERSVDLERSLERISYPKAEPHSVSQGTMLGYRPLVVGASAHADVMRILVQDDIC